MNCPTDVQPHIIHAHTVYSVLDGASTVGEYVKYAKTHGLGSCGICDHGYSLGLHDLITTCNKEGIMPIAGVEFYLAPRPDYVFLKKEYDYGHIGLWAQNEVGYKNLLTLCSCSWNPDNVVHKWGRPKPRITWQDMAVFSEGLLCGSGCIEGPISKSMLRGEVDEAIKNAAILKEIFGDRLYFEVMPHHVNKDFAREPVYTVKDTQGEIYSFLGGDTVETPEGRLTILEVMKRNISEIWDPIPNRSQLSPIRPPGMPTRQLEESYVDETVEAETEVVSRRVISSITDELERIENADNPRNVD